jgi:hypothetical protein
VILEELDEEINQKTNKLVIDYLASLFVSGSTNLKNQEWFNCLDDSTQTEISLYIQTLKSYVRLKTVCNRFKKLDILSEEELNAKEFNLKLAIFHKLRLRKILTDKGINFKQYHKSDLL